MAIIECAWKDLFDDSERESLSDGLFLTGAMSVALGLLINLSILATNLKLDRSYRNLANFTLVACTRRILPLIAHFPIFDYFESQTSSIKYCEFCGFLETFLAVFEIEWLTHVCIERYVVAKYTINGWPIQKYHYLLFQCLCLFFASLYTVPPLLGIGRYDFDFSCSFCTFDVILPESWKRYVVVMIFILRSVKPATVMLMMLIWARSLENKLACSYETREQVKFTKNVIIITLVNQICWFPIALIRGIVILSQLISYPPVPVSAIFIKWAMLIHWMSPALTALVLFSGDNKMREKMLRLYSKKTADEVEDKRE